MKNILLLGALLITQVVFAQDNVEKNLTGAKSYYGEKNLQETRYALQETLRELDIIIGKEILKILPESFDQYRSKPEDDQVMGNAGGITGLSVTREYYMKPEEPDDNILINLFNNSPMLAAVNSFLTNPLFMNRADDSQKVVRISGYKGLLSKKMTEEVHTGYELQIPFGQSLFTMNFEKINKETTVMGYAGMVDLKKIIALAGGN